MTGPLHGVHVAVLAGLGFDDDAVAGLTNAGVVRQSAPRRSVDN